VCFKDKEGGLIVDYVGIASALKQAMNDYTARDKKNYGDTDIAKVAYPKFIEKLSKLPRSFPRIRLFQVHKWHRS
jgi:type I restriction enzyme R subunit